MEEKSLLSGIVIAYLKITKYFKTFAHAQTRAFTKANFQKRFGKNHFLPVP